MRSQQFAPFAKIMVSDAARQIRSAIAEEIASMSPDELGSDEIKTYLLEKYQIDELILDFDSLTVDVSTAKVPAEHHPSSRFLVRAGQSYERQILTFMIPMSGDTDLLHWSGSTRSMSMPEFFVKDGHLAFEVVDFVSDKAKIEAIKRMHLSPLKSVYEGMSKEVAQLNAGLNGTITADLQSRQELVDKRREFVAELGVPIFRRKNIPPEIDITRKPKPFVGLESSKSKDEPILSSAAYTDVVEIIVQAGISIERHESLHKGKDEEGLRDNLLMALAPQFENSATGETFNRSGKTDILIGHKSSNVFVAECKVWHGTKMMHEAVDQLIGYLTWRDTKTALIVFVREGAMSPIVEKAEAAIASHSRYKSKITPITKNTSSYQFSLDPEGDDEFTLTLILFHIPS